MVNVVNDLVTQGGIVQVDGHRELKGRLEDIEAGVPQSLQHMIEQQLERLGAEDQRLLEVASVAGAEFPAAAVAAGMATEVEVIEEQCGELARREQFLRTAGTTEWPDGTVAARYGFLHALYQDVVYHRLTIRRQQRLHRQIGEREEAAYGDRGKEIAAELAVHFERGRDYRKAVQYLQQAGENAVRRSANQEAISLLTKGLELLKFLPDTPERAQQELMLRIALGVPLVLTKGHAAAEVERDTTRARALCAQAGDPPQLFSVLLGLRRFYFSRGELWTAHELGEQLLTLAQRLQDPGLLARAHLMSGEVLYRLGEFTQTREHAEQGIALYDSQQHRSHALLYGNDTGVGCLSNEALALWHLGYPDQALKRLHDALTLARELSHPFSLALALLYATWLYQLLWEKQAVQEWAEAVITLSTDQGFPMYLALGTTLRGWALAEQGQIREGMAAYRVSGGEVLQPHLLALLAEAYGKVGQTGEGLAALAEALAVVDKTGASFCEAELYRLKGQITLQSRQVENKSKISRGQVESKSKITNTQHLTPKRRRKPKRVF
jgi:tetratricopeptide (TPR) repeat protein